MKNGKKPTREQRKFLSSKGYETSCYLVVKNTSDELVVLNKETKQVEEVKR
ncbi:MAG: hypothetical protein K0R54_2106 [Clostridiaceae bacterium]|jgi:hypothetical protein|nr:hypothetical protein [Clostridiaceae bacterium]